MIILCSAEGQKQEGSVEETRRHSVSRHFITPPVAPPAPGIHSELREDSGCYVTREVRRRSQGLLVFCSVIHCRLSEVVVRRNLVRHFIQP